MTKNSLTLLQGNKSPWLPSVNANEDIDHSTSAIAPALLVMLRSKYTETKLTKNSIV